MHHRRLAETVPQLGHDAIHLHGGLSELRTGHLAGNLFGAALELLHLTAPIEEVDAEEAEQEPEEEDHNTDEDHDGGGGGGFFHFLEGDDWVVGRILIAVLSHNTVAQLIFEENLAMMALVVTCCCCRCCSARLI